MKKRLFGTDGVRGVVGEEPLTFSNVKRLAQAAGEFFGGGKLVMGRDTRASGKQIVEIWTEALVATGNKVENHGILPTPVLSVLLKHNAGAMGGVMITASHNPAEHNGIKLLGADGEKLSDADEQKIEKRALALAEVEGEFATESVVGEGGEGAKSAKAAEVYVELLKADLGEFDFGGQEILVDAAAGAGHDFVQRVLGAFGAKAVLIDPKPTGQNINDGCGVLFPEKLAQMAAEREVAGVALDGDADRLMLADEEGHMWSGDRIVVLVAEELKRRGELAQNTVVLTEYSNFATLKYLMKKGIKVEKVENGDRYVAEKLMELGAVLGGELAGHVIYRPWLSSSDGVMLALFVLKLARERGTRLADLWADYEEMPTRQWGLAVKEKRELSEVEGYEQALAMAEQELKGKGRVFVRYSGTENKLRILVEAEEMVTVERIGESLAKIIRKELGA